MSSCNFAFRHCGVFKGGWTLVIVVTNRSFLPQTPCSLCYGPVTVFLFQANGTFIVKPDNTTAKGVCSKTTANLTLVFNEGHITFMFNKVPLGSHTWKNPNEHLVWELMRSVWF